MEDRGRQPSVSAGTAKGSGGRVLDRRSFLERSAASAIAIGTLSAGVAGAAAAAAPATATPGLSAARRLTYAGVIEALNVSETSPVRAADPSALVEQLAVDYAAASDVGRSNIDIALDAVATATGDSFLNQSLSTRIETLRHCRQSRRKPRGVVVEEGLLVQYAIGLATSSFDPSERFDPLSAPV